MIRSIVEGVLGPLGRQLLYYYEAHALPINLVVLSYGLFMLMSWTTLLRIYRHIIVLLAKQIHEHPNLNRKSTVKHIGDTLAIPWQEAVDAARFPLISRPTSVFPMRKTLTNVQNVIDEKDLILGALEVLKGTHPRRIRPSYIRMRKQEIEQIKEQTGGDKSEKRPARR
jgi:hypothetical protein